MKPDGYFVSRCKAGWNPAAENSRPATFRGGSGRRCRPAALANRPLGKATLGARFVRKTRIDHIPVPGPRRRRRSWSRFTHVGLGHIRRKPRSVGRDELRNEVTEQRRGA